MFDMCSSTIGTVRSGCGCGADATELGVARDQNDTEAQISGEKRCTVTAAADAQHQQVAVQVYFRVDGM